MDASTAQKRWELENEVESLADEVYHFDERTHTSIVSSKPWDKDVHYFRSCKISALALLKMTMHARSGGNMEVMGLMIGKVIPNTIVVIDSFPLPVEGTETRVNPQSEAYEHMITFLNSEQAHGHKENVVGWYHSHPGYGCWLSGIDCSTQMLNQQYQEPFAAIVIDPIRTISSGKVNLGAFRTYPKGYTPPDEGPSEYQYIPLEKIEDFGVHCKQYYALEVSYFKSSLDHKLLDSLWNKYWVNTLSSSSLLSQEDYMTEQTVDLADKIEQLEAQVIRYSQWDSQERKIEDRMNKLSKDASKLALEQLHAVSAQMVKDSLFNKKL